MSIDTEKKIVRTLIFPTRRKWMDEIHEVTGMKLAELRDVTTKWNHWRRLVKTVVTAQRVNSTRQQGR